MVFLCDVIPTVEYASLCKLPAKMSGYRQFLVEIEPMVFPESWIQDPAPGLPACMASRKNKEKEKNIKSKKCHWRPRFPCLAVGSWGVGGIAGHLLGQPTANSSILPGE